ncbi:MAG TPA: tRNA pseudouridine(55) synthase TruB [Solirubrobacteraceae bacterium]|nr:tRNA pseudouridine(55) synthase TruB [Solirubrobacteraceae bacterium]
MSAGLPAPGVRPGDHVLLYDKPAGMTSHDVVAAVRRGLPRRTKVGHAGTLDPFATGLLLILVGRATRAQRFLMELPKRYEVVARFGATSTTGDPEGEITHTGRVPRGELELPVGRVRQRPPAYSAVKVQGRRAYQLARAGVDVQLAEREVRVYRFEQLWQRDDRRAFVIDCSSGTYVRSLIADLGDAYCEQLRRTRVGDFEVTDADPGRPVPLADALTFLPEVRLAGEDARRAAHGARVPVPSGEGMAGAGSSPLSGEAAPAPGTFRLTDESGLIALARLEPDGRSLRPVVGLRGAEGGA